MHFDHLQNHYGANVTVRQAISIMAFDQPCQCKSTLAINLGCLGICKPQSAWDLSCCLRHGQRLEWKVLSPLEPVRGSPVFNKATTVRLTNDFMRYQVLLY